MSTVLDHTSSISRHRYTYILTAPHLTTCWPFSRDAFSKYDWQAEGRANIFLLRTVLLQILIWFPLHKGKYPAVFNTIYCRHTLNEELVSNNCQPDAFVKVVICKSGNLSLKIWSRRNPYFHSCAKFLVVSCQFLEGKVLCKNCVCQLADKISNNNWLS